MTMTMQIKNAKIEEATVGFKYTTAVLCAKLKFETVENGCSDQHELCFDFRNQEDINRLEKLMKIAEVSALHELKGKHVRIGYIWGRGCFGFGSLIEDKFIPMKSEKCVEVTEEDFTKISVNFLEENFRSSRVLKS